jgi:hypothetical protein
MNGAAESWGQRDRRPQAVIRLAEHKAFAGVGVVMSGSLDGRRVDIVDGQDAAMGVLIYPDGQCRLFTNLTDFEMSVNLRSLADSLDGGLVMVEPCAADGETEDAPGGKQFVSSRAALLTVVLYRDGRRRVLSSRGGAWAAVHLRRVADSLDQEAAV